MITYHILRRTHQQISTNTLQIITAWQSPGCSMAIGNTGNTFRCLNRVNWRYCILRHGFGVGGSGSKICSAAEGWHRYDVVCARNWRGRIACLCWNNCSRSFRKLALHDILRCFPLFSHEFAAGFFPRSRMFAVFSAH